MKKLILYAAAWIMLASCGGPPSGDKATITEKQKTPEGKGEVFTVDTSGSKVKFTGYGVGKKHPGTFHVTSGTVSVENDRITAGDFVINVTSLELEDKGDVFEKKLKPHLLSGDFFDAEKFNTARFVISGVEPYDHDKKDTSIVEGANFNVSGNLTIKDVTRNITFPAKIDLDKDKLTANANFDIDRTQWKMNYGSDKTLGDKFISPSVNVKLDLKATREGNGEQASR
jgi:polyisoprenoid-binding protein YceI